MTDEAPSRLRRDELASFLRNRRERVTPAEVGLPAGPRRRTPGLRREELAQLAGVGVTWYTWLEQGRRINASVQVLDAIARVLRLGPSERWHLYRLAEVPGVPVPVESETVEPELLGMLDALDPAPACLYNGRYDLVAGNASFAAIFPSLTAATGHARNALWQIYVAPDGSPVKDPQVCEAMVFQLRANYAGHLGDPRWTSLIDELCASSTEFATLWAEHRVSAPPPPTTKAFECFGLGTVRVRAIGLTVSRADMRLVTYLPESPADVALIAELRARVERMQRPA